MQEVTEAPFFRLVSAERRKQCWKKPRVWKSDRLFVIAEVQAFLLLLLPTSSSFFLEKATWQHQVSL